MQLTVFKDLEIVGAEIVDGMALSVGYDDIEDDEAGVDGDGRRGLGLSVRMGRGKQKKDSGDDRTGSGVGRQRQAKDLFNGNTEPRRGRETVHVRRVVCWFSFCEIVVV